MIHALQILLLGAAAGWLAGILMRQPGKGLLNVIIIGILGSIVGSYLFEWIDLEPKRILGTFIMALVGSCVVLLLLRWLKSNL